MFLLEVMASELDTLPELSRSASIFFAVKYLNDAFALAQGEDVNNLPRRFGIAPKLIQYLERLATDVFLWLVIFMAGFENGASSEAAQQSVEFLSSYPPPSERR